MTAPSCSPYVIIGAGIHGLSTAYHLAIQLKATGRGTGRDIIVLEKSGICAGATGIACGVIRNNYFQPAMRELMAHSVNIWERRNPCARVTTSGNTLLSITRFWVIPDWAGYMPVMNDAREGPQRGY